MTKGYQIIEPACLGELSTLNGSVDVAVALRTNELDPCTIQPTFERAPSASTS